jgi:hypothetical protein
MTNFALASARRRGRLKQLVERLEQLPASPERDRVISEVRSRAVDLDTGVTPRAMLTVDAAILGPRRPPNKRQFADLAAGSEHDPGRVVVERRTLR